MVKTSNSHGKKRIEIDYSPLPHQKDFHNCPTRFLVAVCGRQVGKTVSCVNELIKRASVNKGTRNWYVTNDYKQAKRNVWQLLLHYLPKEIVSSVNTSELSVTLTNGSKIELIGVENAERLRGAVVHFMVLDEYADFPRHVWPTVLRPMFATTAGDAWFIGTPKGMGNDLYDMYHSESERITKFRYPSCDIVDNRVVNLTSKYASQEELQNAFEDSRERGRVDEFNQEYLAEFTRPAGTVYKSWPLENFRKVDYDPYKPLHLTFDFGVNDPTAIIWIQPMGGEFGAIDYYEASNANIAHFVQVIKSKPYKEPDLCTGDAAGKARSITTNTSPIDEYAAHGIHIKTVPGLKIPDQVRLTQKHIKGLFVDEKLTRLRDCLLNYHYPEKSEKIVNQSNEIPVHDEWSHGMRALEYYFANYTPLPDITVNNDFSKWRIA